MSSSAPPPQAGASRGRGWIRTLLVAGTIFIVLAIFALFAARQTLDADNWAETSTELLENPAVRTQVSAFVVEQVYSNVDVRGEVARALPPRLEPLAGPAANGLRELAERRMNRLLGRPRVQDAWTAANKFTAQQVINVAEGNPGVITASGGAVILDLRLLMTELVERLGLPQALADRVPDNAGQIRIMSGSQVDSVQNMATLIRVLAFILPVLGFGCLALAVYLDRGRRRRTLLTVGIDLIVAGVLVLALRNLAGSYLTDELAPTDAVVPAVEAVWDIGSRLLRDAAQAAVIIGIPVVLAALLAGPSRAATWMRRTAAPWLRDEPAIAYGAAAALVLAFVWWGPIQATRQLIPVLIMFALVMLGVHQLRKQTVAEFPDATTGDARNALRALFARERRPQTSNGRGLQATHVDQLERLSLLHDRGVLTDAEFEAEKATLTAAGAH